MHTKIGVIVGRFQTPYLHKGHQQLINTAVSECNRVLILVGTRVCQPTLRNPLSYEDRKSMIMLYLKQQGFHLQNIEVVPFYDMPSDEEWLANLDVKLPKHGDDYSVVLYGGRDSFLSMYKGNLPVRYVEDLTGTSSTALREKEPDFMQYVGQGTDMLSIHLGYRHGLIEATRRRFPTSYQAVDIIPYSLQKPWLVLLGRKKLHQGKYCFIGGFVDPTDASLEAAAERELREETNAEGCWFQYIGSCQVNDYRYKDTTDGVMTALFKCSVDNVDWLKASDDLDEILWVPEEEVAGLLAPSHVPLWEKAQGK